MLRVTLTGDKPSQVPHRGEGDDLGVLELAESGLGVGLGAVAGDHLGRRPLVAAGDQDPLAEQLGRQFAAGGVVDGPGDPHWTDSKIRVHVSYCVTALAVAHLMRRQARNDGLDLSVRELLGELAGIQETVLLYPSAAGRPRARRMLTDMSLTQQHLYELFGLDRYAPLR